MSEMDGWEPTTYTKDFFHVIQRTGMPGKYRWEWDAYSWCGVEDTLEAAIAAAAKAREEKPE